MKRLSRRDFIKTSGFTLVSVGLVGPTFARSSVSAAQSALAVGAQGAGDHILIVIQLSGGNDTLNTVLPYTGDAYTAYRQYRPTIGKTRDGVVTSFRQP